MIKSILICFYFYLVRLLDMEKSCLAVIRTSHDRDAKPTYESGDQAAER